MMIVIIGSSLTIWQHFGEIQQQRRMKPSSMHVCTAEKVK